MKKTLNLNQLKSICSMGYFITQRLSLDSRELSCIVLEACIFDSIGNKLIAIVIPWSITIYKVSGSIDTHPKS